MAKKMKLYFVSRFQKVMLIVKLWANCWHILCIWDFATWQRLDYYRNDKIILHNLILTTSIVNQTDVWAKMSVTQSPVSCPSVFPLPISSFNHSKNSLWVCSGSWCGLSPRNTKANKLFLKWLFVYQRRNTHL